MWRGLCNEGILLAGAPPDEEDSANTQPVPSEATTVATEVDGDAEVASSLPPPPVLIPESAPVGQWRASDGDQTQ
eukprot:4031183-Pyramimonas_sp.AAC.1